MQKPSDERLIAYLDGELAESERAEIALLLWESAALIVLPLVSRV